MRLRFRCLCFCLRLRRLLSHGRVAAVAGLVRRLYIVVVFGARAARSSVGTVEGLLVAEVMLAAMCIAVLWRTHVSLCDSRRLGRAHLGWRS